MELTQITDYQAIAESLLIEQYKDSVNLIGVLNTKSEQANDLEQAIFEVRDSIYLDVATGAQLDIIGHVWNVPRVGLNDNEYRAAIEFKVALRISGTIPELIQILKSVYGATYVEYFPQYPAKFLIISDADINQTELESISPAGVGVFFIDPDIDETFYVDEEGSYYISEDNNFYGPEE